MIFGAPDGTVRHDDDTTAGYWGLSEGGIPFYINVLDQMRKISKVEELQEPFICKKWRRNARLWV